MKIFYELFVKKKSLSKSEGSHAMVNTQKKQHTENEYNTEKRVDSITTMSNETRKQRAEKTRMNNEQEVPRLLLLPRYFAFSLLSFSLVVVVCCV
jgi:hypothetical protein